MPINTTLVLNEADSEVIRAAVTYYTGSVPSFTVMGQGRVNVRADGYYMAIGA